MMPRPTTENGSPPSVRELAEQTFAMQQLDNRENSVRRQRDDTLYRRTMDPTLSRTREDRPDETSMPKLNKQAGLLQKQDIRRRETGNRTTPPRREGAQETPKVAQVALHPSEAPERPPKAPTMLHRVGSYCSNNKIIVFLILLAIVGCVVLIGCDWKKASTDQ